MSKEKLTPAEGDTSAPAPEGADLPESSSGDETPDSQAGRDSSEVKDWVPIARFSQVSRERAKFKDANDKLRNELRRKQIELAIADKYAKDYGLDPLHRRMFIEMTLDWSSCFDPDGVLDTEILYQALREFESGHHDGYLIGSLPGGSGDPDYNRRSGPWGPEKRDPYETRRERNRDFLSKAYAKKDD